MTSQTLRYARAAGILYLVTHVTSVGAVVTYGAALRPSGIHLGILLEFILALGCLGTGILLLPLLRQHGEVRALSFAALRALEAAVILAGTLPMFVIASDWNDGDTDLTLVAMHAASFLIGQGLVIAVNTVILGSLLLSSRHVPRALAMLALTGGVIVLISDLAQLLELIPRNGAIAGLCALPIFAFEIWFAVTLIIGRSFTKSAAHAES